MSEDRAVHRMTDPAVRLRVAFMLACMVAIAWVSVTMLGRESGPFTQRELPDLAGLPILVPQIQRLVPPKTASIPDINLPALTPQSPASTGGVAP